MREVGGHHSGDNINTATDCFHLRPISTLPCGAAWPLWLNFNSLRMSDPMQLNLAPLRAAFDRKVADRCACPLYPPLPFIGFAPLCIHPVLRHTLHALPTMCGKAPSGRGDGPSTNDCAFYPLPPPLDPTPCPDLQKHPQALEGMPFTKQCTLPPPRPQTMPQNAPRYHQALEGGPHQEEVKKLKLKREAARKEFEVRQSLPSAGAVESLLRCG